MTVLSFAAILAASGDPVYDYLNTWAGYAQHWLTPIAVLVIVGAVVSHYTQGHRGGQTLIGAAIGLLIAKVLLLVVTGSFF